MSIFTQTSKYNSYTLIFSLGSNKWVHFERHTEPWTYSYKKKGTKFAFQGEGDQTFDMTNHNRHLIIVHKERLSHDLKNK